MTAFLFSSSNLILLVYWVAVARSSARLMSTRIVPSSTSSVERNLTCRTPLPVPSRMPTRSWSRAPSKNFRFTCALNPSMLTIGVVPSEYTGTCHLTSSRSCGKCVRTICRSHTATSLCGVLKRSTYSSTLATFRVLRSLPCMLSSFLRSRSCHLRFTRLLILLQEDWAAVLVQEDRGETPRVAVGLSEEPHASSLQLFVGRTDVVRA